VSVWSVIWRLVDAALGVAQGIDERRERKKMLRRLDQLGDAMARDARRGAPTVILPPRPTIPPAASGAASPTAPRIPPRRR
jgi:hypothetical protein